jgi:hypothetical protein
MTVSIGGLANKIQSKYVRFFEKKIANHLHGVPDRRISINETLNPGEFGNKGNIGFRPPMIEQSQIDKNRQALKGPQAMDTLDLSVIRDKGTGSDGTLALFDEFVDNNLSHYQN